MTKITISAVINGSKENVWKYWNEPEHIKSWAFASDTWECPASTNDLKVGGRFSATMAAKDKSASFDFCGTYTEVEEYKKISYTMDKGEQDPEARKCEVIFETIAPGQVKITEIFDAETENSIELQQSGWQSILNNFKKYAESLNV